MAGNKELSRDDLFLLMESYKTTIESNTTLLQQQETLLQQHNTIIDKQKEVSQSISQILKDLGQYTKEIGELEHSLLEAKNECKTSVTEVLSNHNLERVKEHSSIKLRLYIVYAGLVGVVASLTTLLIGAFDKFKIIEEIARQLTMG